jgi:hypothetical protein
MKKTTTKKAVLSRLMMSSALLLFTAGPVATTLVSVPVASAQTSSNPVADTTSDRSITLTKYQAVDANDHGTAGDGTLQTVTNTPLEGVKFELQRVLPVSGGAQLVDPTQQKLGTDYTIDSSFTAQTLATDANGQIKWDLGTGTANDGIYIVTEVDDSGAIDPTTGKPVTVVMAANPFFVYVPQTQRGVANPGLIYNVNVQPKNVIQNALNPNKTIGTDPNPGNDSTTDSLVAGDTFYWGMTTGIPNSLYTIAKDDTTVPIFDANGNEVKNTDGSQFTITIPAGQPIYIPAGTGPDGTAYPAQSNFNMTDTLNKDLIYKGATMWVETASGWTQLNSADYTISTTTNADGTTAFKASLTAQGIKEVGSGSATDVNGVSITGPFTNIQTRIESTVAPNWDGAIPNTFDVNFQTPGGTPQTQTPPPGTEPVYYDGGFNILKEDASTKAELAGAQFMISDSAADAAANKFFATDGNLYQYNPGSTPLVDNGDGTANDTTGALPSGVKWLITTSNSNGSAAFNGLPLTFTDGNGNGVLDLDGNGLPTNGDTVTKDYYVVETVAPNGYELLKTPQKVTVTLGSHGTVALTVDDTKSTNLPFTGGTGTVLMVTVALGAIGIGTAMIVINKKHKSEEA